MSRQVMGLVSSQVFYGNTIVIRLGRYDWRGSGNAQRFPNGLGLAIYHQQISVSVIRERACPAPSGAAY